MTTPPTNGAAPAPSGLVAVVGLGCVMPDASNVDEFWNNLRTGRNSIREVPRERWDPALYYDPDRKAPDKTYTKIGAFVTGFRFDSSQVRIPPSVVKALDESQLWAIAAAQQALSDGGYDQKPFDRSRCAIILGNSMGGETRGATGLRVAFPALRKALEESAAFRTLRAADRDRVLAETETGFKAGLPEITEDTMPGELSNVIAGRIANVLNLTGKNFTTDAACASSLAAIDAATKALLARECDLVLTGGVDRSMDVATYVKFCKIGALSPNGSFPFDERADGFVMGEGAGMLLLKRLEDAERDGDRIYAVFRGVGSSSDGKGKGITAPNIDGQISCVTRALSDAGVTPDTLDLLECHGTSTKVGDVVEVQALAKIFGPYSVRRQSIPMGSVKSNIGHLKSAAGAASLLKIVKALQERVLPPSINFQTPNPNLRLEETPFYVITSARPWPEPPAGRPRRASISSFGFGGTNFHVILEEYAPGKNTPKGFPTGAAAAALIPPPPPSPISSVILKSAPQHRNLEPLAPNARTELLAVGAPDWARMEAEVARLQTALRQHVTPRNLASFLADHNAQALQHPTRLALVLESHAEAADRLALALEGVRDPKKRPLLANKGIHYGEGPAPGRVAFLFPGQGSQYADMLRDLSTRFEPVKRTLEEADRTMLPLVGKPLTDFLFTDPAAGRDREKAEEFLKRTEITQPAVLAADLALFRALASYGVRPDVVAGHSLGEYGALVAAGVLTFEDAVLAVSARGREMANVHVPDLGKMASVSADPATVEAKLKSVAGYVIPANKNCKAQTVIAGASLSVEAAVKMFNEQGIPAQLIPVSAAFHSAIVAPAKEPLRRVLERLDFRAPKVPVLSNVHADYYPTGSKARDAALDLLGSQVAAPVEWQRQIERMYQDGARLFVEVGPKAVLTTFVKNILEGRPHGAVATNHPKKGGFYHFFDALAALAASGVPLRLPLPEDASVNLPAYRGTVESLPAAPSVVRAAFPQLETTAEGFIREKQEELRRVLLQQIEAAAPPVGPGRDGETAALRKRIEDLGLNLEPILITGVSVGTPGTTKKLFDDHNFDRVFRGENAIEPLPPSDLAKQVEKNVVRLVKSASGDHHFETIRDVAEVIKLAGRKGEFNFEKDYGVSQEFADALDITSKMAIAAGIEALRDAQIPLVRGYVKTTTGKFLPGEWALPEPLQADTGIIFASVWPGVPKIIEHVSRFLAHKYVKRGREELRALYGELVAALRNPQARADAEAWFQRHEAELGAGDAAEQEAFNRRFLFHVLSMGHSQLAQFIRAKGPNTQINSACATTTLGVALAEDWIRTGRCKRVLIVGADDITGPEMLEYWASGFLAAGAATTEGDVRKAALPFDKRRHGMIVGMGCVGIVLEAESEVQARGMEGITEVLASVAANSAYHGSRLDTEHIAALMDQIVATVEKRTGVPRREIARTLLFMSHETYTPARGGSAAAEILALHRTFGDDVSKVVVANTKGFTGHPMAVGLEDAIAVRSLQTGRVPPIANLEQPDADLGSIQLSRGGTYDLQYGLRLGAGFGSQVAMFVMRLRSKDATRIVDPARYRAWLAAASGTRNPELEVVNRTLRVKASLPPLAMPEAEPPASPGHSPSVAPPPPSPAPKPAPLLVGAAPTREQVQERIIQLMAEKTGYTRDLLDPNLDLEADLGIDTVKQAEFFGLLRAMYDLPRDDSISLKEYSTISKISEYLRGRLQGGAASPVPAMAPAPGPTPPSIAAAAPASRAAPAPATAALPVGDAHGRVRDRLLSLVAERTGYPREMLDLHLDLEADLGIDTVKQAEVFGLLRTEFGLERDDNVQLKDFNTLQRIIEYIGGRLGVAAPTPTPPVVSAPPAPMPPAFPPPPAAASSATREETVVRIRGMVAEKTGYPPEMLEENLDLEADLGIDTVKQAEIFGLVRESFGIPRLENLQLKDYNTLGRFADFVLQQSATATGPAAAPQPVAVQVAVTPVAPAEPETATKRYIVRYVPVSAPAPETSLSGKTLLVWAPPAIRSELAEAIGSRAGIAHPLEALPRTFAEAKAWVEDLRRRLPRINGLLFVPTPAPMGSDFEPDDVAPVKSHFFLVKAILSTAHAGEVDTFGVATFLGGDFAARPQAPLNPLEGAFVGLGKAVAKELPGATVKCVDFAPRTDPAHLTATLLDELGRRDGLVEVGTAEGRGTLKLVPRETVEEEPGVELGRKDVIVVSGGGSGITSDVVAALAERSPCAFLLFGRTRFLPNSAELASKTPAEWNLVRQEVARDLAARGDRATPVAVEREVQKLQKSAEIHRTLEALHAAGSLAEYRACDVTDAKAVESAVAEARRTWGKITGVIHAAGVEESKLIVDKTPESFDRVFDVKVLGARSLLRATANDPLKFFVSFSSVAGRFGNVGQADYSAANDCLAKLSACLRQERGDAFPAVTIDWSAWADRGMATRGSVMTVLREAGVVPIPLSAGVRRFVDELAHGGQDAEVLIAADLGRLGPPEAFAVLDAAPPRPTATAPDWAAPRLEPPIAGTQGQTVLVVQPAEGKTGNLLTSIAGQEPHSVTATLLLDPAKDPYLHDHAVDGTPYLPGVFGLEVFAEAAQRLVPGLRYVGARNVEYALPVKVLRNRPVEVTIVARVATESDGQTEVDCRLQSVFVNAQGERMGAPRIHFTGSLLFAQQASPPGSPTPAPHHGSVKTRAEIYRHFFHGPSFQVLDGLRIDPDLASGTWANPDAPLFGDRKPEFLAQPLLVEFAFQTAGGHLLFQDRQLALPKGIGRLTQHDIVDSSQPLTAVARKTSARDAVAHYDVLVQTSDGRPVLSLEDFQLIRLRALVEAAPAPSDAGPTAASPPPPESVYKARWGHDFPIPRPDVQGCRIQRDELHAMDLRAEECLTSGERADQERFRNTGRSEEFLLGRLAAKEAVAGLLSRPLREARGIEIRRLESGEPVARGSGLDDVLVSITHTGQTAIAVAARRSAQLRTLGIDAERVEEKPPAFETEAFAPPEIQLIDDLYVQGRPRAELQVRFWAVKEAVLKALGQGFALDLHHVQVRALDESDRANVELAPPAQKCLEALGARTVQVQTWMQDGLAYALASTRP